jgi:hypothetical protein
MSSILKSKKGAYFYIFSHLKHAVIIIFVNCDVQGVVLGKRTGFLHI